MAGIVHIVDDDPSVRDATSFLLSSHGYSTRVYAGGAEFLEQAVLDNGCCVLLDLRMRDMSGLQVLEQLAQADIPTPVIMLTGHGDIATAVQALKLGAVDFIQKPYDEQELVTAIERAAVGTAHNRRRGDVRDAAAELIARLSGREVQVLRGLVAGMTNKEMARALELSPRTVEMHRSTMMADLGVASAADAIRIGIEAELTALGQEPATKAAAEAEPGAAPRARTAPVPARGALDRILPPVLDALEGSTDGVLLVDHRFNITWLNGNAMKALAGGGELVGADLAKAFPGARSTSAWDRLRRAVDDRVAANFELFAPEAERWFDISVRPIPSGLQIFFRDLTLERTTDAALRQSEEKLRLALEASGDGAWDWDIAGGRIHVSRRSAERLGYGEAVQVVAPAAIWRLIHPADQSLLKSRLAEHLAGHVESFTCEYRVRTRSGGWRWHVDRGRIVTRDPLSGAPQRMVGISTDISAQKAMQASVAEANALIKLAQEGAGAGLWEYDLDTGWVRLDPRSRAMHGLAAEGTDRIEFELWKTLLHPEDVGTTVQALDEAVHSGESFATRFRVVQPNGETCWILCTGRLAHSEDGSTRIVGLNLDETEREFAARKLERLQADLLDVGRTSAIGTMAAALANELNQPLTAISNYVKGLRLALAQRAASPDAGLAAVLEDAEASARAATAIVRRIREKASLTRLHRQAEPLAEMIRDAARIALTGVDARRCDLRISVATEAARVLADRVQVQQVIIHLIRNAAEAMKDVPRRCQISVHAAIGRRHLVEVRVSDRGPGIPDRIRERLFAPLLHTGGEGLGMGLAVCRTIVESHGGRIWAEPAPGGGTTIAFTLECARKPSAEPSIKEKGAARPSRASPPERFRPAAPAAPRVPAERRSRQLTTAETRFVYGRDRSRKGLP